MLRLLSFLICTVTFCGSAAEPRTLANIWSVIVKESSESAPAIDINGNIYFGTFGGKLWSISPQGRTNWIFRAGREIKSSPAIGIDGTFYFGSRDWKFYAVSSFGKRLWDFKTGGWVDSSPAIDTSGTVYFGSWDKKFYAFNKSGIKKWEFPTGGPIVSSPAIGAEGTIYFGSHDGNFYALHPDGQKAWHYNAGAQIISSPAIDADGTVYFTSVNGWFHAVKSNGTSKWRLKTGGITESSPVIGQDGTIYVAVNEKICAISADGKIRWEKPWARLIRTSPIAIDDNSVAFLAGAGTLVNLSNPENLNWSAYEGWSGFQPAVGGDGSCYALYIIQNVGFALAAQNSGAKLARSSWPKFRGGTAGNCGRVLSP